MNTVNPFFSSGSAEEGSHRTTRVPKGVFPLGKNSDTELALCDAVASARFLFSFPPQPFLLLLSQETLVPVLL